MPRLSKRSRKKGKKTKRRTRKRLAKVKGGERLECGQVAYAATYRPLSFGEKVKLKFCKDKEPDKVAPYSTRNDSITSF